MPVTKRGSVPVTKRGSVRVGVTPRALVVLALEVDDGSGGVGTELSPLDAVIIATEMLQNAVEAIGLAQQIEDSGSVVIPGQGGDA